MKVVSGKLIRKKFTKCQVNYKNGPSIFEEKQLDELIKVIKNIKYKIGKY